MSSLEINKYVAAVLLAGVIAMTAGFVSKLMIHPTAPDEPVYLAAATTGDTGGAADAAPAGPEPILALLASADVAAGEKGAKKCTACHTFEEGGAQKIGPNLYDIVGRQVAAVGGFGYSQALQDRASDSWDYDNLNAFLAKPKDWAPGTKMSFAGIKKPGDRAAMVAYLRSLSASPAPLPSEEDIAAASAEGESMAEEAESMVEKVVEAASEAAEDATEMAEEAAEAVTEAASEAAEGATEMAEEAAEGAAAAAASATAAVQEAAESASTAVQEATESATTAVQQATEGASSEAASTAASTQQAAAETGSGLGPQIAAADPDLAKKVSRKCTVCHTFEQGGKNKLGPNLYGVIGRNVASVEGFKYSSAFQEKSGETWTYEALDAFLTKPKDWAKGNKMTFVGLRKENERAAIIAFLRTYHDDPPALPE